VVRRPSQIHPRDQPHYADGGFTRGHWGYYRRGRGTVVHNGQPSAR
jgi:hypothetical protein